MPGRTVAAGVINLHIVVARAVVKLDGIQLHEILKSDGQFVGVAKRPQLSVVKKGGVAGPDDAVRCRVVGASGDRGRIA